MTFGFALMLAGFILLDAGWKGTTPVAVLQGLTAGQKGPGGVLKEAGEGTLVSFTGNHSETTGGGGLGTPQSQAAASKVRGVGTFDGHPVAKWIIPYLKYARAHGWTGHVTSGYRSKREQEQIYNSGVRPAAVPGTSNHEGKVFPRGAVDVTEAEQLSKILEHMPGGSLLKWAGSADPVHFSFPHNGGY